MALATSARMRFRRLRREKPTSSRSSSMSAAKAATSSSTSVVQPIQSSRTSAAETRRANQAPAPSSRRAGQRGGEQRAPAQAALAEIGERRAREAAGRPPSARRPRPRRLPAPRPRPAPRRCWDRRDRTRAAGAAPGSALMRGWSPSRNSMARSRRMCGRAGSSPEGRLEADARRAEAQEMDAGVRRGRPAARAASVRLAGSSGRSPGNTAASVRPSNSLAAQALARQRHADDAGQPLPARARLRLARGPAARPAPSPSPRRRQTTPARWPCRRPGAGSPPAGRGWCGAGGRPWWRRTAAGRCGAAGRLESQVLAPGRKHLRIASMRALQVGERAGAGVDGGERVDQHDLPVEAGEVVAEERLHHVRLVALEAARQHGARGCRAGSRCRPRAAAGRR